MSFDNRVELFERIEAIRKAPLISYVTSIRPGATGQISADVILEFTRQIERVDRSSESIDVLIVSNGGDPIVSWRIVSLLRERFKKVSVLLPYAAYSAATLISLGADEIVMHPFSNLGPVDPQLQYVRRNNGPGEGIENVNFGSEDLRNFVKYAREEVGITDQNELGRIVEHLCREVGAIPIGVAKRSAHLALQMGEQLLSLHLTDHNKAKSIAEALNSSFYHHGYPLGPKEVEKIGLPVTRPDEDLEGLLWAVWEDIQNEMECSYPFVPVQIVLGDPSAAALLNPVPQAQIPANLPPPVMQSVINQILSQINVVHVPPVAYEMLQATLESTRCVSQFRSKLNLTATRLPDMNISVSVLPLFSGWIFEDKSSTNSALEPTEN